MTDIQCFQQNTVDEQLFTRSTYFYGVLHYCIFAGSCIYIYTSCLCVRMGGIYYELKCYSQVISDIGTHANNMPCSELLNFPLNIYFIASYPFLLQFTKFHIRFQTPSPCLIMTNNSFVCFLEKRYKNVSCVNVFRACCN